MTKSLHDLVFHLVSAWAARSDVRCVRIYGVADTRGVPRRAEGLQSMSISALAVIVAVALSSQR